MKKIAKLVLFFCFCFLTFFLAATLLQFLSSWIDTVRVIPPEQSTPREVANSAFKAIPIALYFTILVALSYSVRKKINTFLAIFSIFILGVIFSVSGSLVLNRLHIINPVFKPASTINTDPGLILSTSGNTIVLLKESSDVRGPRVVSIPGQPLIYREVPFGPNNTLLGLPALPFKDNTPWFIKSIMIDFSLSAEELNTRLETDIKSFGIYVLALVLLLSSFYFLLDLCRWPLANLFLGSIVFRGILSLEPFLNSGEIKKLTGSFLGKYVEPMFLTPLIFGAIGILIILFTILTKIAQTKTNRGNDD